MTMAELRKMRSDYIALKKEIEDCTEEITALGNEQIVTDVVIGSSTDDPYTKHPVTISGIGQDVETKRIGRQRRRIIEQRAAAIQKKQEIEDFIDGVEDRFIKWTIKKHIISGMTWRQVLNRCDDVLTVEALIMRIKRYIKPLTFNWQ